MEVKTVSRLHLGLIDMNGGIGRVDGGVGLALDEPCISLTAETSDRLRVNGPLADRIRLGAETVIEAVNGRPVRIDVDSAFPQHVGLGSGTQAALAGGLVAAKLNDSELSIWEIGRITGRGGTSGIGIASFEGGGFVADGGHSLDEKGDFLPSSASSAEPPSVISRLDFPDWNLKVLVPEGEGLHGEPEVAFFRRECPIPESEVEAVSRMVLMKLLPSVAEANFDQFREAVNTIQRVGFKEREIAIQERSKEIIDVLQERGCAAGMSSWGPAVYAIHPDEVDAGGFGCDVYHSGPNNHGAEIET